MEFINGEYSGYIYIGLIWLALYILVRPAMRLYSGFQTSDTGLSNRDSDKLFHLVLDLEHLSDATVNDFKTKVESLIAKLEKKYRGNTKALSYIEEQKVQLSGHIKYELQKDEVIPDVERIIDITLAATSTAELKRDSDKLIAELKNKYEGNPIGYDIIFPSYRELTDKRMAELQKQEAEQ